MENTKTPETIWKIHEPSMIVDKLTFVSVHPTNPRYAIYLDSQSKEPIRVYIPNMWESFERSNIAALSKAEYIAKTRLDFVRSEIERISQLG